MNLELSSPADCRLDRELLILVPSPIKVSGFDVQIWLSLLLWLLFLGLAVSSGEICGGETELEQERKLEKTEWFDDLDGDGDGDGIEHEHGCGR